MNNKTALNISAQLTEFRRAKLTQPTMTEDEDKKVSDLKVKEPATPITIKRDISIIIGIALGLTAAVPTSQVESIVGSFSAVWEPLSETAFSINEYTTLDIIQVRAAALSVYSWRYRVGLDSVHYTVLKGNEFINGLCCSDHLMAESIARSFIEE